MRDADDPTRRRRARSDAELDARVQAAIDAWRELGPEGTGRFAEDELGGDEIEGVAEGSDVAARPRGAFGRSSEESDVAARPRVGLGRSSEESDVAARPRGAFGRSSEESDVAMRPRGSGGGSESSVLRRLSALGGGSESSVLRRLGVLLEGSEPEAPRRSSAASESADSAVVVRPSFVDRVMAAEAERARPRAFEVPAIATAPAPRRSFLGSVRRRWAGLGLAAAGMLAVLAVGRPWSTPEPMTSEPTPASAPPTAGSAVAGGLEVPELAAEGTPGQPVPDDLGARIEAYIGEYGRNYGPTFKFHGVVLVARGGRVLYQRGFGTADPTTGTPNTMFTRFRLGLLTEPFTATAVLQLRDEGLLRLDDTIDRWLPELRHSNQITVRDLLSHRSGIPNYTDSPSFPQWKSKPHDTDAMVERLAKLPLEFTPGSATAPSNSNYYLLGAIIERITGTSYGEHMAEHVLRPAGMAQTGFGDAWETGEQAQGNVWSEEETLEPPGPIDMSTFGGAGGLVSSPADLLAWDRALRAGELLAADSVDEMSTPTDDGYGFGWLVTRAYGQTLLSFPGAIDGYSGSMLRFVDDETLVVVLANTEVVPGAQVAQDVAMMVYGDEPPQRHEPAEVSIAPATYEKYVGSYGISAQTRQTYADAVPAERFDLLATVHVEQEGDRLYFNVPGHARTWMHPMGRNRFFFKDHTGNTVSFELGEDNRATRMVVHYQGARFMLDRSGDGK